MYYGYNDNKQLVMADEAFIELLGYNSFNELIEGNIIDSLKFENNKIVIEQDNQKINSDFSHHEIYGTIGDFYLVELKNITVEKNTRIAGVDLSGFPNVIMLIGMDLIRNGELFYNGPAKSWVYRIFSKPRTYQEALNTDNKPKDKMPKQPTSKKKPVNKKKRKEKNKQARKTRKKNH